PGFIDLHAHGQTNESHRFRVHDGVTTALELESGRPFLRQWLETKEGQTLIHYGATMAQSAPSLNGDGEVSRRRSRGS
ncbi:MAG: amidohydrolase family protein, partial [Vicinamibacteria bacterium]